MGKIAIITGISGQDGSYLSQLLLKKNYKIIGLTNPNNKKKIKSDQITLKNIDLNNFEARYQFERVGYFIRDNKFLDQGIIYNKIVSLKDTWKKTKNKDTK